MRPIIAWAGVALMALPAMAEDVPPGREIYLDHCATCHGLDHDGEGPMAGVMTVKPANLSTLTAGNDGVFPLVRVIERIDGRDPLVAHGSPMPVYGDFFEGNDVALKTESGQPILTSGPVSDLVDYLRAVQE
ncbi:Cytochrome c [Salinihabitans flavidus]|uniref:Cytochrome c n=1 Tax=Salinihabitans flavidus TaxID=569882 RepID=A0A1H8UCY1_9RHOB|nr:c-type cytochrome [Salinihabitans flavidus]SEP01031.1 Cytochrome c [Salinihabitans flavidus]